MIMFFPIVAPSDCIGRVISPGLNRIIGTVSQIDNDILLFWSRPIMELEAILILDLPYAHLWPYVRHGTGLAMVLHHQGERVCYKNLLLWVEQWNIKHQVPHVWSVGTGNRSA